MASYTEVTTNKLITVDSNKLENYHIGNLYGGLKNEDNSFTGNIETNILSYDLTIDGNWAKITLQKIDNTAYKILMDISANTSASTRNCILKLKYNNILSDIAITINQTGISSSSTESIDCYIQINTTHSILLSISVIPELDIAHNSQESPTLYEQLCNVVSYYCMVPSTQDNIYKLNLIKENNIYYIKNGFLSNNFQTYTIYTSMSFSTLIPNVTHISKMKFDNNILIYIYYVDYQDANEVIFQVDNGISLLYNNAIKGEYTKSNPLNIFV